MNKLLNRTLSDIKVEIDMPVYVYEKWGTPEYWKRLERELEHEIKDLEEFIRDHRSRDYYGISTAKYYVMTCKYCGHEYPDDYNGIVDCCDKAIEEEQENIKSLILGDE